VPRPQPAPVCRSKKINCRFRSQPGNSEVHADPDLSSFDIGELEGIRLALCRLTSSRVRNREDAEDIVQETLLTLACKAPHADLEKNLMAFGIGIMRKKLGNYYRNCRRAPAKISLPEFFSGCQARSQGNTPEAVLLQSEFSGLARALARELPPAERQALEYYFEGHKTGEIARLLKPVRYQNVLNRLHRGLRRLTRKLIKLGYGRGPRPRHSGQPRA
jgi:RNA polymerase sigma factor (sigma-70 family)